MFNYLLLPCFLIVNLINRVDGKFPSQQDFDYVEDLLDNWKITRQSSGQGKFNDRTKGIVKIGSFAPSSTRLIENVDTGYSDSSDSYYQQPTSHQEFVKQSPEYQHYQPQYGLSSVPHSYGQPVIQSSSSYPDHHYYHHPHHHQPTTDHHYYHHNHGSSHHHDSSDHQDHSPPSTTSSGQSTATTVRQQSSEPSTQQRVIQYIPLPINSRQSNRSPTTSPWLWSLLFVIIFPTLLGAILLPLALVFLTNIVFVLLMLRNNNQQTQIIPNPQNKLRSRTFSRPLQLDDEMIKFIFNLLHKANSIYGSSKIDLFN